MNIWKWRVRLLVNSISSVSSNRLRPVNRYEAVEKSKVSFGFKMGARQVIYREGLQTLKKMLKGTMYVCGAPFIALLHVVRSIRRSSESAGEFIDKVRSFWGYFVRNPLDF